MTPHDTPDYDYDDDMFFVDDDLTLSDVVRFIGGFIVFVLAVLFLVTLTGCASGPQDHYYSTSPAEHMLAVGQTLIKADQGGYAR